VSAAPKLPRCGNCTNWVRGETPEWARDLGMAVCALKNTKAVTLPNWWGCGKHVRAEAAEVRARVVWLREVGAVLRDDAGAASRVAVGGAGAVAGRVGGLAGGAAGGFAGGRRGVK